MPLALIWVPHQMKIFETGVVLLALYLLLQIYSWKSNSLYFLKTQQYGICTDSLSFSFQLKES